MKKRDIFARLNREFDELTPEASEELKNAPIVRAAPASAKRAAPARKKRPVFLRRLTAAAAAIAVTAGVVATVLAFLPPSNITNDYLKNDTYISLSINPALSVIADSDGKVTEITTRNRDAEILLAGTDRKSLVGKDYDYVVSYLTGEAASLGYFAAAGNMTVAAVSCGGEDKTASIARKLKAGAEETLAAKGVKATVTVSELDRGGLLTEAGRVDPQLKGDEDLSALLNVLSKDKGYIKKFGGEIETLFGDDADEAVENLYQMELLDEYADLLEDRCEFLAEIGEFNDELGGEDGKDKKYKKPDKDEDTSDDDDEEEENGDGMTVAAAFAADDCGFAAPDGWWLTAYVRKYQDAGKDLEELAEEFAELFDDYEEYGLTGLEPLLADGAPNLAAPARLGEYLAVCNAVDFEELEDYVDELEDLLDDLSEANYAKISALFEELLAKLQELGADWEDFVASKGEVGGVSDYLKKTEQSFRELYDAKKNAVK